MALTLNTRGTDTITLPGTSFTVSVGSNCGAGQLIVLLLAHDNSAAGGADPFDTGTGITDSRGNTWTNRTQNTKTGGNPDDGLSTRMVQTLQDVGTLQAGDTITVPYTTTVTSAVAAIYEVTSDSGYADYPGAGNSGTTNGTSSAPSKTSNAGQVVAGDAVVALIGWEYGSSTTLVLTTGSNYVDDSNQYVTVGSFLNGISMTAAAEIADNTADQTIAGTLSSSRDWSSLIARFAEVVAPSAGGGLSSRVSTKLSIGL